jgi:N-acetyl-anhydromuramoyl-L-alanine amidase
MPVHYNIDADGWCKTALRRPSPNFDDRPETAQVNLLVIHNISLPPGQFGGGFIADLFQNRLDHDADPYFDQLRGLRVSAHFLIRRDGATVQFVSTEDRAWHAGVSSFEGLDRCNDFSIGIELEGTDYVPFSLSQYAVLSELTVVLQHRYPLRYVVGHQHIAPGRKTDPGLFFDWHGYQLAYRQCLDRQVSPALAGNVLSFPVSL